MEQIHAGNSPGTNPTFVPPKLTYEEFLNEYDGSYVEYVNSEVIGPMTVGLRHNQLTGFLQSLLQFFVEVKKLGLILTEPFQMKLEFEGVVHGREPDVFFIKNENTERLTDRYFVGGADLAIEVLSPDSIVRDTQDKFIEYERAGVSEYWIIDPNTRTANFYGFDESGRYQLLPLAPDGKFVSRVIDGLWIKTDWLWEEPLPDMIAVFKEWGLV